jgi:hypothetical protein
MTKKERPSRKVIVGRAWRQVKNFVNYKTDNRMVADVGSQAEKLVPTLIAGRRDQVWSGWRIT